MFLLVRSFLYWWYLRIVHIFISKCSFVPLFFLFYCHLRKQASSATGVRSVSFHYHCLSIIIKWTLFARRPHGKVNGELQDTRPPFTRGPAMSLWEEVGGSLARMRVLATTTTSLKWHSFPIEQISFQGPIREKSHSKIPIRVTN